MTEFKHINSMLGVSDTHTRTKGDFYETPEIALEKLYNQESFSGEVWEPACGKGQISEFIKNKGNSVYSSDLYDWGYTGIDLMCDFLTFDRETDNIITNPPFNISTEFALKALEATKERKGKVALLNRVQWLEGQKRKKLLYDNNCFKKLIVFSGRLPRMHRYDHVGKETSNMICYAWFIWDHAYTGKPTVEWV